MKKFFLITLSILIVAIVLLLAGLQIYLTRGLASTLNSTVFPEVEKTYGVKLSISGASVNLFKGTATLNELTVSNLKNYEEPYLLTAERGYVEIDLFSLLRRKPVVFKNIEATGAVLTVEKNSEGKINIQQIAAALTPEKPETPAPETPPAEPPAEEAPPAPIPVHIRRIMAEAQVRFVNIIENKPLDLSLRFTGNDIFTVPESSQPDTLIVLRGALTQNQHAFVTDLNAIVKPLVNPELPSFSAAGSILDISSDLITDLLAKNNAECSSFSVKPTITSRDGIIDGSRVELVLNELKLQGAEIGEASLKIPLSGKWNAPKADISGAIRSLFSKQALNIGKALLQKNMANNVKELSDAPVTQELIEKIIPNSTSTESTNTLGETIGGAIAEQLEKNVKELKGNEEAVEAIKKLSTSIFGK